MFLVEMDLKFGFAAEPVSDDEITDLIESLVDELDHLPVEPSVGTHRVDDGIEVTIGVVVDADDRFEALSQGAAIIRVALEKLRLGPTGFVAPPDDLLTSSVRTLQAA